MSQTVPKSLLAGVLLLAGAAAGCVPLPAGGEKPVPAAVFSEQAVRLRSDPTGLIALVLTPFPPGRTIPVGGVHQALRDAAAAGPCAAAVFFQEEQRAAEAWVREECQHRREHGLAPRLALGGHSTAGAEVCELAKHLLATEPDLTIELLVTVDAVKNGGLGGATSAAAALLTQPVPKVAPAFSAYRGAPRVDGRRVLAHANYYQLQTAGYQGGPMPGTANNFPLLSEPSYAINHGNVDDYAYAYVLADFRQAIQRGAGDGR